MALVRWSSDLARARVVLSRESAVWRFPRVCQLRTEIGVAIVSDMLGQYWPWQGLRAWAQLRLQGQITCPGAGPVRAGGRGPVRGLHVLSRHACDACVHMCQAKHIYGTGIRHTGLSFEFSFKYEYIHPIIHQT